MNDTDIIYGCNLHKLSNDELLAYYEKLICAIENGWKHDGRYILKDFTKYEIRERMERA